MKYRISSNKSMTKSETRRLIIKWIIYFICLLVFFMIMRSGAFGTWQPFLIIPLAIAVSLYERELSSCVFALFCGYFIDIACRFIFGFSAVWLMVICVTASLLSRNLIQVNFLNFMWISFVAIILEFSMDYLFNTVIWNKSSGEIILDITIIPSAVSTIILSPLVFFIIRYVNIKFSQSDRFRFYLPDKLNEEDEIKVKE